MTGMIPSVDMKRTVQIYLKRTWCFISILAWHILVHMKPIPNISPQKSRLRLARYSRIWLGKEAYSEAAV
jgi:hypothetical protein